MDAVEAYNRWHAERDVDEAVDSPWHQAVLSRVDRQCDIIGRRVLEVGCGRGGFSCWLGRNGAAEVVAGDFSQTAVDMGRNHAERVGLQNVHWRRKDIEQMDDADGYFDTVFSFETIEHVPNPAKAVAELARVLKPGGRLYLTTPNYLSTIGLYRLYCRLVGKVFDEGGQPICQLTMLPITRRWVRAAGLQILETDSVGQFLPFPGRPPVRLRWAESPRIIMRWFGLHSLTVAVKPTWL